MTRDPKELISRYFDEVLTEEEHQALQDWLRSAPDHAGEFAKVALLHDRLRGEQLAMTLMPPRRASSGEMTSSRRSWRSWFISAGMLAACVALLFVSLEIGKTSAAAATELQRIIVAQESDRDRTYRLAVEEVPLLPQKRPRQVEDSRPPKPPLDGALLHVRKGQQFVLIRNMPNGQRFVTGSNGRTSWAVRPDGPVRVSHDLNRFNHDLPGHEHNFPLIQIEEGLVHLQAAYNIELLPVESVEEAGDDDSSTRLLVAVKKRGQRGPQRVEISYVVSTGQIRQLRFVGMPYGPEHLTVQLSLEDEQPLGGTFFDHQSHHASGRAVEEE